MLKNLLLKNLACNSYKFTSDLATFTKRMCIVSALWICCYNLDVVYCEIRHKTTLSTFLLEVTKYV